MIKRSAKTFCFLIILIIAGFQACKDQQPKPVLAFSFKLDTLAAIPAADSGVYQDSAFVMRYTLKNDEALKERGLNRQDIKDVQLDSAKVNYRKAQGFQWLDSVIVSLSAPKLDRELAAQKTSIPNDSTQNLSLNPTQISLAPYIQQETFYILLATKNRQATKRPKNVFLQLFFQFRYEGS
jgi:hypothetical protein